MTPFDWVALVGAAAWVPQVLGWVAKRLAQPKLRVIPGRIPEVGYTSLGPIFNFPCAISADRKDAIIERVSARITHANGHAIDFVWVFLNETFSQVKSAEGVAEVGRNQAAVALKVSTLLMTEKQIGMQERDFDQDARGLITALQDHHDHLKKTEPDNYQQMTLKSKPLADLMAFAERRFPWQEGAYAVRLELRIAGVKDPHVQQFHFTLTALEVARLRQNLEEIKRYVAELIAPPDDAAARPYRWNWANPLLTSSGAVSAVSVSTR